MLKKISLAALIIATVFTISKFFHFKILITESTGPFPLDWSIDIPEGDTAFGGLFADPEVNDSLPHYTYRRLEDSLKKIYADKQLENRSVTGNGRNVGVIGVHSARKTWKNWEKLPLDSLSKLMMDSLTRIDEKFINQHNTDSLKNYRDEIGEIMWRYNVRQNKLVQEKNKAPDIYQYYFGLNGYDLNRENEGTKFFIDNGKFYLAYVKWDSVIKREFDSTKTGHYERKQIKVRYNADDKRILIPITYKKYKLIYGIIEILFYLNIFLFAYFFIGLPVGILINIGKGEAFNAKNIKGFKTMALVLFIYAGIITMAPFIVRFFFRHLIPDNFEILPLQWRLTNNLYLFLIAIGLFIVGKAFQRGYKLQQEQDLTV